ncbi:alanine:cation symporter family protein [Myxococcota bacterium]|nr:alanine:cation symporter family protein [Myxococcota bacterium]
MRYRIGSVGLLLFMLGLPTARAEETPAPGAIVNTTAIPEVEAPKAEAAEASKAEAAEASKAEAAEASKAEAAEASKAEAAEDIAGQLDAAFAVVVGAMAKVLFWIPLKDLPIPLVVWILMLGSIFYTFFYGFLNVRGFKHAIDVVRGKYDDPDHPGEISHFQALTSALSATVGLGNIAGVAVAIGVGGPGATVWMILMGVFGMSAKFHECSLAQVYRTVDKDGTVHGGPMYYLEHGLAEMGLFPLGKALAVIFALFAIMGSFGGGNMFQANQAFAAVNAQLGVESSAFKFIFGFGLAFLVGLVIIGGIKKIGQVTEKIIPLMVGIYLIAGVVILVTHAGHIPEAIRAMYDGFMHPTAALGGFVGVLIQGVKRAVFSNEAGIGSAAIAHSAARTDEPIREGIVALLEPFIDTVVICFMTALILIISGAYKHPEAGQGIEMTRWAFADTISFFPWVLAICIFLFAYSTMISWSYYGEKAWGYLFGRSDKGTMIYRFIFLGFVIIGTVSSLDNVITFSDLAILSMAFPNIIGGLILAPKLKKLFNEYWGKHQRGEFKAFK